MTSPETTDKIGKSLRGCKRRMTKVNKKDATKELAAGASKVLDKASRMRKSADALMQSLRKMEARFTKEEEERAAQKRREEQQKVLSSHSKAFTMLDEDEKAAIAAARAEDEAAAAAAEAVEPELDLSVPEGISIDDPVRMYLKEIG